MTINWYLFVLFIVEASITKIPFDVDLEFV